MKERNMSNLCFVATCIFKMSILLYSKTSHEENKHVKFTFCNNIYIQKCLFCGILKQLVMERNYLDSCLLAKCRSNLWY